MLEHVVRADEEYAGDETGRDFPGAPEDVLAVRGGDGRGGEAGEKREEGDGGVEEEVGGVGGISLVVGSSIRRKKCFGWVSGI